MARLHNPGISLRKALRDANQGLARAQVEGLAGMTQRVREAVAASEGLVRLLERLARDGHLRPGAPAPLPAGEVLAATRAVRATIGAIAMTTPSQFSARFDEYADCVGKLVVLAERVSEQGIQFPEPETDEWEPFR